jgi:hypothetical protein
VVGDFPAQGFNGMNTANCQGNQICINWRNSLNLVNGGQLPQGAGTVTTTCQDGAGVVQPDCNNPQPTFLATVNVTVNWNDLRGARTVTLTTRMMRP